MAITVNGQILRNLPEQVSKNTEDILDLQDVSNNYGIRITALEGDAIALATFQDCTFTGTTNVNGGLVMNGNFTLSNGILTAEDVSAENAAIESLSVSSSAAIESLSVSSSLDSAVIKSDNPVIPKSSNIWVKRVGTVDYRFENEITTPTGISCTYAKARVSNAKLNIVLAFSAASGSNIDVPTTLQLGVLPVSSSILNYMVSPIGRQKFQLYDPFGNDMLTKNFSLNLNLVSGGIQFAIQGASQETATLAKNYAIRIEFNFILS